METPQHVPKDPEERRMLWEKKRKELQGEEGREIDLTTFVRPKKPDMRDMSDLRELNDGREITLI